MLSQIAALPVTAQTWTGAEGFVETRAPAPESRDRDQPAWPVIARLSGPTDAYDHDVLGGIPPWTMLEVTARACGACRHGRESHAVTLPADLVFEDVAPRLWDATGDGLPEVVVVETSLTRGARLAVWAYGGQGLTRLAVTPFIGQPHRWLAPVAAADLDGDGRIELAYVDRPHLARELVVVRLQGDRLVEVDRLSGITAHRIGDVSITGGHRTCAGQGSLLLPDAGWSRLVAVSLGAEGLRASDLGPWSDRAFQAAMTCTDIP